MASPVSANYTGWAVPTGGGSGRLYVAGTLVATFDDATNDLVLPTNGLTITAGGLTVTAGGATITAGNAVVTAGDVRVTAGNVRLGAVSAFGTTEPTSAVVMKVGTAPAGAITTSGGIFTDGTTVKKIIAAGTVSDVQT